VNLKNDSPCNPPPTTQPFSPSHEKVKTRQ
jgi:hypothetical protein